MDDSPTVRLTQVVLDRLQFAAQTVSTPEFLRTARIEQAVDAIYGNLVHSITAKVMAEKLVGETVTAETFVPKSWWQHFKLTNCYRGLSRDRIMRYCAKRWPVQMEKRVVTVRFDRYALFPESKLRVPELGKPVVFEQWGEPSWRVEE